MSCLTKNGWAAELIGLCLAQNNRFSPNHLSIGGNHGITGDVATHRREVYIAPPDGRLAMKRYSVFLVALVAVSTLTLAYRVEAQRPRNRAKARSLQATPDASGVHPDNFDTTGPVTFTCLNAVSETPNSRPEPSCHITAPGFNKLLKKGERGNATDAGTGALTCSGQGNLRFSARVDIPAPAAAPST